MTENLVTGSDEAYIFSEDEEEGEGDECFSPSSPPHSFSPSLSEQDLSSLDPDDSLDQTLDNYQNQTHDQEQTNDQENENEKEKEGKKRSTSSASLVEDSDEKVEFFAPPPSHFAPPPPSHSAPPPSSPRPSSGSSSSISSPRPSSSSSSSSSSSDQKEEEKRERMGTMRGTMSPFGRVYSEGEEGNGEAEEDQETIFKIMDYLLRFHKDFLEPLPAASVLVDHPSKKKKKKKGLFGRKDKKSDKPKSKPKPVDKMKAL